MTMTSALPLLASVIVGGPAQGWPPAWQHYFSRGKNWAIDARGTLFVDRFTRADARARRDPFADIRWKTGPDADMISMRAAIALPQEIQTDIKCRSWTGGRLGACAIEIIQPDSPAVRAFVSRLARRFRVDPAQLRSHAGNIDFLTLALRIENRAGVRGPTPCIPVFCVIHYDWNMPPPPPASKPGQ